MVLCVARSVRVVFGVRRAVIEGVGLRKVEKEGLRK